MESTDQQLSQGFDQFLARQRHVDEAKFPALLAELVEQHPLRDLMRQCSEYGGGICTAPADGDWVTINYRFRDYHFTVGKRNLRHSTSGPTG
jgi:hypothetical protein